MENFLSVKLMQTLELRVVTVITISVSALYACVFSMYSLIDHPKREDEQLDELHATRLPELGIEPGDTG